jgi:hypothetical protein
MEYAAKSCWVATMAATITKCKLSILLLQVAFVLSKLQEHAAHQIKKKILGTLAVLKQLLYKKKKKIEIKGTNNRMGHGFPPKFHNS